MVKGCSLHLNGMQAKVDLYVIPLGSYDVLIGMDWLDVMIMFFDDSGNQIMIKGISINSIDLSRAGEEVYRRGCQLYTVHAKEIISEKKPWIEGFPVL